MAKKTKKAFIEKAELRKREIFLSTDGDMEAPFETKYELGNGYSMLVEYKREEDGTPYCCSTLLLNGKAVDVSDKTYEYGPVYVNSYNGNCYVVIEHMQWPLFSYYSAGEIKLLKKGDAVRFVVIDGTIKNAIIKEINAKVVYVQTAEESRNLELKYYGEVWKLTSPSSGQLNRPLKEACHTEAVYRLYDAGFDAEEVSVLVEPLKEELFESCIFEDGDAVVQAMKDVARKYLEVILSDVCREQLEEISYDMKFATDVVRRNIWEEIENLSDSQKKIFAFVVGINNHNNVKEILTGEKNLKNLSFRFIDVTLWEEQKKLLKDAEFFVYDLRDWDDGDGYNIEVCARANNIGNWVTNVDLAPYMHEGKWIGRDELDEAEMEFLPYAEIEGLLRLGKDIHFAKEREKAIFAKLKEDSLLKVVRKEDDWYFILSDMGGNIKEQGYTAYRDLSMYPGKNEIIYILEYCLDMPDAEYVIL